MDSQIHRLANGNIQLTLTIPWTEIQSAYDQVLDQAVKTAEIKGFRPGHAPRSEVESRLDRGHTFSLALQRLLPPAYQRAVDKHGLKPVVYPSIRIDQGREGKDWVFVATVCEAPPVKLGKLAKLEQLVKTSQVQVPDLLVMAEANRRLSQLAENLTQLGLTVDKYLAAKKLNLEDLKAKLAAEARHDLTGEFVLRQVQVEHKLADRKQTLDFLTAKI